MVSGGSQLRGHVGLFVPLTRMAVQTSSPDVKRRLPCQGQDGSQYMGFTAPWNFGSPLKGGPAI